MELLYAQEFLTHKIVFYNIKGVEAPWTYSNCRIFDSRFRSFVAGAYDQFSLMVLILDGNSEYVAQVWRKIGLFWEKKQIFSLSNPWVVQYQKRLVLPQSLFVFVHHFGLRLIAVFPLRSSLVLYSNNSEGPPALIRNKQ